MTFKTLRHILDHIQTKKAFIQWKNSGIFEIVELLPTGAIKVINVITQKEYLIPRRYSNLNIRIVRGNRTVSINQLMPKSK